MDSIAKLACDLNRCSLDAKPGQTECASFGCQRIEKAIRSESRRAKAEEAERIGHDLALDVGKMDCAKDKRLLAVSIQCLRVRAAALRKED